MPILKIGVMLQLRNRRALIGIVAGGALTLAVAAVAFVYFVVFPSSAPAKLALATASATPTTSSSATESAGTVAGNWTVASGSRAGYRVRETLASIGAPSEAVGRTSSVHGDLTLTQSGSTYSVSAANLTVDVNTLASDSSMRDRRIHSQGLQSDRFPTATFVLSSPISLPTDAGNGQVFTAQASGNLTIHGVTKAVRIPIQAKLAGSQIQLAGSITFPFSDFGMTPPSVGGFVSVQSNATMEFALNLSHQAA